MLSLGNVTYLLDVAPSKPLLHLLSHHFVLFKFRDLVAKQHPTNIYTYLANFMYNFRVILYRFVADVG